MVDSRPGAGILAARSSPATLRRQRVGGANRIAARRHHRPVGANGRPRRRGVHRQGRSQGNPFAFGGP